MTGFRPAVALKNLMVGCFMAKGCQKNLTACEQRPSINIALCVAPPSLFEALFPEVAL